MYCVSAHLEPGIDYIIDPLNDCLNGSLDNSTFLLGYFSHTRQRCCLNITIVDNDYQEELLIEFNATLSLPDASGLLSVDVSPAVTTVVIIDDDQCGGLRMAMCVCTCVKYVCEVIIMYV